MVGSCIALLEELVLIVLFLLKAQLRESPGDIFFGSLFFEMILAIDLLLTSLLDQLDGSLRSQSLMCQFTAGLNIIASTIQPNVDCGELLYVVAFFHYLSTKVKTSFRANSGRTWKLHISILLSTLLVVILVFTFNVSGKNMDGECSIQLFKLPDYVLIVGYVLLICGYLAVGLYSIWHVRQNIPTNYKVKAQKFLRFSVLYFVTFLALTVFSQSMNLTANLNCQYLLGLNMDVLYGFAALFQVSLIISLPIIRSNDPYTKKIIRKTFGIEARKPLFSLELSDMQDSGIRPPSRTEDNTFVNLIQSNKRQQIMAKMVAGLNIDQYSKFHSIDVEIINMKSDNIFDEKKTFNFVSDQLLTQQPAIANDQFIEIIEQNFEMKMISYTPIIFHVIMKREAEQINILESMNLSNNIDKIRNAGKNDGGKSGQFFFYSQDNQLIMKTITQQELRILLTKLQSYFQYLLSNPTSLIAKIYGIYTFEQANEKPINIIVMKNIARTTNNHRIYDLKGSSFDRQVAKKDNDSDISNMVLKDIDFLNFERYLYVSNPDAQFIIRNAQLDAQFFKSCGLIDYSLIVFKIVNDDDNPCTYKTNVFQCDDIRYRYHIGIIDYLQEYDVQKKVEKYSKKFIKFDQNLDTSSQDPETYCARFSNFVQLIVKVD